MRRRRAKAEGQSQCPCRVDNNFADYDPRPEYLPSLDVVPKRRAEFAGDRQSVEVPAKRQERQVLYRNARLTS
jgi:hypothetical protein